MPGTIAKQIMKIYAAVLVYRSKGPNFRVIPMSGIGVFC
jgi:hypothetical protein